MVDQGKVMFGVGVVLMIGSFFVPVSIGGVAQYGEGVANIDMMMMRTMATIVGAAFTVAGAVLEAGRSLTKQGERKAQQVAASEKETFEQQY